MTTINLNIPLKDLDGKELTETNLGKNLAAQLVSVAQGNVVKHYDWALALHKGNPIQVDQADFEYLKRFVENSQTITILAKHQISEVMDESNKKL